MLRWLLRSIALIAIAVAVYAILPRIALVAVTLARRWALGSAPVESIEVSLGISVCHIVAGAIAACIVGRIVQHEEGRPIWRIALRVVTVLGAVGSLFTLQYVRTFATIEAMAFIPIAVRHAIVRPPEEERPPTSPTSVVLVSLLAAVVVLGAVGRFLALRFGAPHENLGSPARVPAPLDNRLLPAADPASPNVRPIPDSPPILSVDDMIDRAMNFVADRLRFGLRHKTSFAFSWTPREGNCIEYAYLFAAAFNQVASEYGAHARAYRIRSHRPTVFGVVLNSPAFRDHDWVLVLADGEAPRFLDPTFFDVGLGADIHSIVDERDTLAECRHVGICRGAR